MLKGLAQRIEKPRRDGAERAASELMLGMLRVEGQRVGLNRGGNALF